MKNNKFYLIVLLQAIIICVLCSGCESNTYTVNSPENTVIEFINCCNNADVNGALEYIDPKISAGISFAMGVINEYADIEIEDILDGFPALSSYVKETGMTDIPELNILNISTESETDTEAYVSVTLEVDDGYSIETQSGSFYLKKINDNWYITDIN